MAWLIRFLFLVNKDWFMAVIISMAVLMFIPEKYQNMWVLGGFAAWVVILHLVMVRAMKVRIVHRVTEMVTRVFIKEDQENDEIPKDSDKK